MVLVGSKENNDCDSNKRKQQPKQQPKHRTYLPTTLSNPSFSQAFTKALDADATHLPTPPLRQYAATHLAMLSAALGHPHEALCTYHTVLAACPDNVAALAGAAETHRARAARDLTRAMSTVAAWDLACGWEYARRACALQPQMAACWKLLGDVLVLHVAATPTGALRVDLETRGEEDVQAGGQPTPHNPQNNPQRDMWGGGLSTTAAVLQAAAAAAAAGDVLTQDACHAVGLRLAAVRRAGAAYARAGALLQDKERGAEESEEETRKREEETRNARGVARLDTAAALYHVCGG